MLFYTYVVRMGSEHENPGRFALDRKKKPFEKTIIFFSDKQFVQKNKCNLYKKAIFFIQNCCRTPYGVRGFKYICVCQFGLVNCTGTYDTSPIWNA